MPKSNCSNCGQIYTWTWEEAFKKFGFNDGDGDVHTATVAAVLGRAGYDPVVNKWGLHNFIIESIKCDGVEMIPATAQVGYDDPRRYLPSAIVKVLDARLGVKADLTEGSV